jgi:hypothetical protein
MGDGTFAAVSAANIPRLSTGVFTGMFAAVHGQRRAPGQKRLTEAGDETGERGRVGDGAADAILARSPEGGEGLTG